MLVGCASVNVHDLTLPSRGTWNGRLVWSVLIWNPVTLPTAWQGDSGQEGSGVVLVWPRTTVVLELVAAPAPPTETTTVTARQTIRIVATTPRLERSGIDGRE